MNIYRLNNDDKIVLFGRTAFTDDGVAVFWTGSAIEFNIKAKSLYINMECGYDVGELMVDIVLDGERTQKFALEKDDSRHQVFSGMNPDKQVRVRIIRDTQCMPDDRESYLIFKSLETDGEIVDPPVYDYNIEFIGDSLTSGEGCGLTKREEWIPVIFDAVENYTYMTAEYLNARYNVLSQSGWGLYAAWDANTKNVLPDYYDKVCGTSECLKCMAAGSDSLWDFSSIEMDAVIINLGTNDSGALNTGKFNKDEFISDFKKKALKFLRDIRSKNPSCSIIWAYGMLSCDMEPYIKEVIEEYKGSSGDERVEFLKLPTCTEKELGVRYHPTRAGHEKTAKCIAGFLQSMQAFMLR